MSALKQSLRFTAAIVFAASTAAAASLPSNLARAAKATATSEFSGQYLAQFVVDGKIPETGSQDHVSQAWCVRAHVAAWCSPHIQTPGLGAESLRDSISHRRIIAGNCERSSTAVLLPPNRVAQPVPAANCGSVPLLARKPGGTPGELAGADACATAQARSWLRGAISKSWRLSPNRVVAEAVGTE